MRKPAQIKLTSEQVKFAEENHKLVYYFLKKYHLDPEEYYGIVAIGYCKAVAKFDKSRGTAFSSFAFILMLQEYLMFIRKLKKDPVTLSYHDTFRTPYGEIPLLELISDPKDYQSEVYAEDSAKTILALLNKTELKYLKLHLLGVKQKTISKAMGVGQSCVSRKLTNIKQKLAKELL